MSRVIIGHFGDESLQAVTCTVALVGLLTLNQNNQETENTYKTQTNATHKMALIIIYKTLKKPRLRERTERAWFSRLTSSGQETERVSILISYNPGARTGQL